MSTPAAGWFPDPAGRPDSYRWWDGAAWSRYLTDDPSALAPVDAGPTPDANASPMQADRASAATAVVEAEPDRVAPRRETRMPPGYDFGRSDGSAPVSNRRLVRLLISIVGAVAVGAIVSALVVHARTEATAPLKPPPPVSSTAKPQITAEFDETSRLLKVPSLQVTMPGSPYTTEKSDFAGFGLFDEGAESRAVVQDNYDGKGGTWIAVVAAGVFKPALFGKDPESTAKKVFKGVVGGGFSDVKVTIKKATSEAASGYSKKAWIVSGDVHYNKKGIESTYDAVSVLVVDAGDGNYVGWISDRPNKSDPALKSAVSASIKTIKIG